MSVGQAIHAVRSVSEEQSRAGEGFQTIGDLDMGPAPSKPTPCDGCVLVNVKRKEVVLKDMSGNEATSFDGRNRPSETAHALLLKRMNWNGDDCIGASVKGGTIRVNSGTIQGCNNIFQRNFARNFRAVVCVVVGVVVGLICARFIGVPYGVGLVFLMLVYLWFDGAFLQCNLNPKSPEYRKGHLTSEQEYAIKSLYEKGGGRCKYANTSWEIIENFCVYSLALFVALLILLFFAVISENYFAWAIFLVLCIVYWACQPDLVDSSFRRLTR